MINLYNKENGALIGSVSEGDLEFLVAQLEEEFIGDKDYFLDGDTIDLLEEAGGSPGLIGILRNAAGEKGEIEIRWS